MSDKITKTANFNPGEINRKSAEQALDRSIARSGLREIGPRKVHQVIEHGERRTIIEANCVKRTER